MLEELIRLDEQLFLFLNGMGNSSWDDFWLYLSRTVSLITIPIYVLIIFSSYNYFGLKRTIILLISVALLLFLTEQLSTLFKNGVGRLRPCYNEEIKGILRLVKRYCGRKYGYFSAHAANSFALATFYGLCFKKKMKSLTFFLVLWALLVSYSRIYIGVHFPLDVLSGIGVGIFLGWLFFKLSQKIKIDA
ncbi:phosphatase PAP2 family protein [uncultured Croceitalea sp.]|uniref:phosphatase PAP2 family protein n=1 Tax=uncultured Croceitalea sp. TaxID=1798908 RepID=UPI003305B508